MLKIFRKQSGQESSTVNNKITMTTLNNTVNQVNMYVFISPISREFFFWCLDIPVPNKLIEQTLKSKFLFFLILSIMIMFLF
jgi:hypothetical protein